MKKCSMQKKIESFKNNKVSEEAVTPKSREDLVVAVNKIRDGWRTLVRGLGDFDTGPYGVLLDSVMNSEPSVSIYPDVWALSFEETRMDEWCDAIIKQIKEYTGDERG